jgi:hypothetical protein
MDMCVRLPVTGKQPGTLYDAVLHVRASACPGSLAS